MQILQQNTNGQIVQINPPTPPTPLGAFVGMGGAYIKNARDGVLFNGNGNRNENENHRKIMHGRNEVRNHHNKDNMLPVPPPAPYVPLHEKVNEVLRIEKDRELDREKLKGRIRESEKSKLREDDCKDRLRLREEDERRLRDIERQARADEFQAQQDRLAAYQYRKAEMNKERMERQRKDDQDAELARMKSAADSKMNKDKDKDKDKDGKKSFDMVEAQKMKVRKYKRCIVYRKV